LSDAICGGRDQPGLLGGDLVHAKIDPASRKKWVEDTRGAASPTVTDLFKLLNDRCQDFELSQAISAIKLDLGRTSLPKRIAHLLQLTVTIAVSVALLTISCVDAGNFRV